MIGIKKHVMSEHSKTKPKAGFSLVEIMISIGLLGFSGFGLLAGLLQSRQMTEAAIRQSTALTIAQGYVEQIKNMEFDSLDEATLPTLFHEGAADTANRFTNTRQSQSGNFQHRHPQFQKY